MRQFNTYVASNKVIVTTRFANRIIKGVAKCDPNDTFDKQVGEKLAKARCDAKVAQALYAKKSKQADYTKAQLDKAIRANIKAQNVKTKAFTSAVKAVDDLIALENSLK